MVLTPATARPATLGPSEYFTGTVRVTPLFQPTSPARTSGASVTFEPGARSAWHTHPLGQTLVVTAGTGWIQQAGEAKREIRAGDVIWTPPGVKHWHGATATSAVTHVAIQEALEGKAVEWMEHVSDEQYLSAIVQPREPGPARADAFGGQPVRSPEVSPDGAVTFRLRAPNAQEVLVRGITPEPIAMRKDEQGVWSVTTAPLKPDLYAYSFVVDGLRTADPSNRRTRPSYYGVSESSVLVPGDNPWTPRTNVARGVVARHSFRSSIAGDDREYLVYTAAGYDPKRKQPYPVLYLLHGLFDDADAWTEVGAANVILDNLIAQGKAAPMVMVNMLGYGNADGPAGHRREDMLPNFGRILLEEVLPRVESRYNVSTERVDRAIAGLSMGGAEATLIGLNHLDTFAWVGSFSGAYNLWPLTRPKLEPPPAGESPADARERFRRELVLDVAGLPRSFPSLDGAANSKLRLLWITCGTDDVLIGVNRQFKKYLDARGVKVTYAEVPDVGHVWPFWRQSLADLVPLLFR
jgi:enterochelin esterase family protein